MLARATRCHLSTAIRASGRAARIPEAYGAEVSITTTSTASRKSALCSASQSFTHAPERPGASPSIRPGPVVSASTNEVSQGSVRRQWASARTHRADLARVSSIPSTLVGSGSGSHLTAAATSTRCAVGQDTPWVWATSSTARFPEAISVAIASRSRQVSRALAEIASDCCVNEPVSHSGSGQARRRLRHHSSTTCPHASRSLTRTNGRSLTRVVRTPHPGQGASRSRCSITTLRSLLLSRSRPVTTNSSSSPNSTDVLSIMLVASCRCRWSETNSMTGATSPLRSGHPAQSRRAEEGRNAHRYQRCDLVTRHTRHAIARMSPGWFEPGSRLCLTPPPGDVVAARRTGPRR